MPRDSDDEALSWAGDDEPALGAPAPEATATATPGVAPGWRVVGKPGNTTQPHDGVQTRKQMGSVALVIHGVLGGIYLLYIIGWLIAAQRDTAAPSDIVGAVMYTVGLWFAVLAPALWFGTVLWVTRHAATSRARLIFLLIGVIVLIPVPFLVGGTA